MPFPRPAPSKRSSRPGELHVNGSLWCAALVLGLNLTLGPLLVTVVRAESQDVVLEDLNGVEHRLSDQRGKWVIMNFWATWCPPCIREMPELEAFHRKHKDTDAIVWGITYEDTPRQQVAAFVKRLEVSYPILGHGEAPNTPFGTIEVLPTTFVINPEGLFQRAFRGPVTAAELEAAISD